MTPEASTIGKKWPRLLTYQQVAEECGIHPVTVRRAVDRGELVAVNAPGTTGNKGKRITSESLLKYLQAQSAGVKP
jgi:hypothetical protein